MTVRRDRGDLDLATLRVDIEEAVLFAEIAASPMNLLGPELVRDLVSLIQRAEADDAIRVLVFRNHLGPEKGVHRCPRSTFTGTPG